MPLGNTLGLTDDDIDGLCDGVLPGTNNGLAEGLDDDGSKEGNTYGVLVGIKDGASVGLSVGFNEHTNSLYISPPLFVAPFNAPTTFTLTAYLSSTVISCTRLFGVMVM